MISQAVIILAVVAAAYASAVAVGAPLLAAGAVPAVSAYGTSINHVAPAAPLGYAGALGYGYAGALGYGYAGALGHGLAAAPLAYGYGAPLAYGHGVAAAPLAYGGLLGARYGVLGLGHGAGVGKAIL